MVTKAVSGQSISMPFVLACSRIPLAAHSPLVPDHQSRHAEHGGWQRARHFHRLPVRSSIPHASANGYPPSKRLEWPITVALFWCAILPA
jgi:hypothetical protein